MLLDAAVGLGFVVIALVLTSAPFTMRMWWAAVGVAWWSGDTEPFRLVHQGVLVGAFVLPDRSTPGPRSIRPAGHRWLDGARSTWSGRVGGRILHDRCTRQPWAHLRAADGVRVRIWRVVSSGRARGRRATHPRERSSATRSSCCPSR